MPKMKKKEKIEYVKKLAADLSIEFKYAWSEYEFYEIYKKVCPDDFKDFREYLEDLYKEDIFDKTIGAMGKDLGKLSFEGGLGESIEDAVIIRGIKSSSTGPFAEGIFLSDKYGKKDIDWTFEKQELIGEKDKVYDVITIRFTDNSLKKVYFDIDEFYMSDIS
jgi:hypothetical protein